MMTPFGTVVWSHMIFAQVLEGIPYLLWMQRNVCTRANLVVPNSRRLICHIQVVLFWTSSWKKSILAKKSTPQPIETNILNMPLWGSAVSARDMLHHLLSTNAVTRESISQLKISWRKFRSDCSPLISVKSGEINWSNRTLFGQKCPRTQMVWQAKVRGFFAYFFSPLMWLGLWCVWTVRIYCSLHGRNLILRFSKENIKDKLKWNARIQCNGERDFQGEGVNGYRRLLKKMERVKYWYSLMQSSYLSPRPSVQARNKILKKLQKRWLPLLLGLLYGMASAFVGNVCLLCCHCTSFLNFYKFL